MRIGNEGKMPLMAYIKKYGDSVNDSEIGAKWRKSFIEYCKYVEKKRPFWIQEGAELRAERQCQKISQKELCELMGICTQSLRKLENGEPIRDRNVKVHSFKNAIKLTILEREKKSKFY